MRLASGRAGKYWANIKDKGAGGMGSEIGPKQIQFFMASDAMGEKHNPNIRVEPGTLESYLGRTDGPAT
eukprot:2231188-Alexandrium_andersonii.AAC.1